MIYLGLHFPQAFSQAPRKAALAASIILLSLGFEAGSSASAGFLEDLFGVGAPSHSSSEPSYAGVAAPSKRAQKADRRARRAGRVHVASSRNARNVAARGMARMKVSNRGSAAGQSYGLAAISDSQGRESGVRQTPIDLVAAKKTVALDRSEEVASIDKTAAGVAERNAALRAEDFLVDRTLRRGDIVATGVGLRVFIGHAKARQKAFLALTEMRDFSKEKRGALAAIDKVSKQPLAGAHPLGGGAH